MRMKKRKTLQAGNKKRQLILKVANEVFAEKGFQETTISQIAQKASIAEGSIYDYFKSKEDLLFSIPEERMEKFLSGLRAHLKGIKGAPSKLRKLIWYQLDFYERNPDYTRILLLDLRQNPRFNQSRAYRMIRQYSKIILEIIEEGKKEKEIRKEVDPYLLRDLLLGALEHFSIRGIVMGKFPNLAVASDDLYDLIISGAENRKQRITLSFEELEKIQRHRGFSSIHR
jgi:TetR/AcrR family transcriptional regulator, fatty acid metabolism regulator protein